jgi:hypothetical protein
MLSALVRRLLTPQARLVSRSRERARLRLEALEERAVPATVTWINPSSGNWADGSNWSTGHAPGSSDDVVIDQPGVTVTHSSGNDTVHSLVEGSSSDIDLTGGSLAFTTTFTVNGTLEVDGGNLNLTNKTLDGTGVVQNTPASTWSLPHTTFTPGLDNQGTLVVTSGTELKGDFLNEAGATLHVIGDATGTFHFEILWEDRGMTNDGTIELDATQPSVISSINTGAGVLVNQADGTIHSVVGAGGTRTIDGQLFNLGTVLTDGPLVVNMSNGDSINEGTFTLGGGDLSFSGPGSSVGFSNDGSITVPAGRTFAVANNGVRFFESSAASITGNGTFLLGRVAATIEGDFATNGLTLRFENSTNWTASGTLTVSPGDTLVLYRGPVIHTPLENAGTILVQGVDAQITSNFVSDTGSTIRVSGDPANFGSSLILSNDFDNHGLIEFTSSGGAYGAGLTVGSNANPGALLNDTDGTISALPGTGGGRTINANVNNQGAISVAANTTLTIFYGGLTNLSNGTLTGGTYDLSGTLAMFNGAVTTNAANLILDGAGWGFTDMTHSRSGLAGLQRNTVAGALTVTNGATLPLGPAPITPAFSNAGYLEIDGTGHVTVNGTWAQTDGLTWLGGGRLTASTISVQGGSVIGNGTLDGNVTNAGQIVAGFAGAPGVMRITGNFTQTSGGDLYLEIGGTNPGTDFGQFVVGGTATLDGVLSVTLINGYTPPGGTAFQVLTAHAVTGAFALLDLDAVLFTPAYHSGDVTLTAN